jgi:SNF2 family DNA or RNA helicase
MGCSRGEWLREIPRRESSLITLRPDQREAVDKMQGKRGFLLADQTGLGKTVMSLMEVKERLQEDGGHVFRVLIIAQKTALETPWADHVRRILPELGEPVSSPHSLIEKALPPRCVYITNWDQIRINPVYKHVYWTYVIGDQAEAIKNRKTKRSKHTKTIPARFKRALTAFPVANRPDELWSILNWLYPEDFRSYWRFYKDFVDYWVNPKHGYHEILGPKNTKHLHNILRDIYLRRTKKDVWEWLPDKTYQIVKVQLAQKQMKAYQDMKRKTVAWIGEHENEILEAPTVLAQLVRLRMFAAGYAGFDENGKVKIVEPSAKCDAAMDLVTATDEPLVIFTGFRGVAKIMTDRLRNANIPTSVLTYQTPKGKVAEQVNDFQEGHTRVFLSTIKMGGTSITLSRAHAGIFIDRHWSPAANYEAEDRYYGRSDNPHGAHIYLIQAEGTVDQVVEKKLELKWKWIREMLDLPKEVTYDGNPGVLAA